MALRLDCYQSTEIPSILFSQQIFCCKIIFLPTISYDELVMYLYHFIVWIITFNPIILTALKVVFLSILKNHIPQTFKLDIPLLKHFYRLGFVREIKMAVSEDTKTKCSPNEKIFRMDK